MTKANRRHLARGLLLAGGASTIVLATPLYAQDGLQDIVVTAQRREQRLQDVAVAVSALSSADLEANRITTVQDLNAIVPNLSVRNQVGGSSLPIYTMRGLVALGSATGADKGIALYIDDVYMGAATGSIFELADIERIEVLRGPQGTLFGRNATAGAIHFITPDPGVDFRVRQTVTLGNHDHFRSVTTLDTGQIGPLSASFTYTHSERRGDIENLGAGTRWDFTPANGGKPAIFTSPKWLGSYNQESVRAAVKLEASDDLEFVYRFDYTEKDYSQNALGTLYMQPLVRAMYAAQPDPSILGGISPKRPKAVNNRGTVPSSLEAWGHTLTTRYQVSDTVSLKNVISYRKLTFEGPFSEVSSVGGLINTGGPAFAGVLGPALAAATIGAPFSVISTSTAGTDKQFSEEFQLVVNHDFVNLTAGALYYTQTPTKGHFGEETGLGLLKSGTFSVFPGYQAPFAGQPAGTMGRISDVKINSYAAYAHGEFHLTPELDISAGIRYTKDKKKGTDYGNFSGASQLISIIDYEGDEVTYDVGVKYSFGPDSLVYAKYSTGYISGGSLAGIIYEPETAKSWEAGLKSDWFGRMLRTNLAVFTVDYANIHFPSSGRNMNPPIAASQVLVNAGDARARGFELEATLIPARGVTLTGGVGYTDFKYKEILPIVLAGNIEFLPSYRPDWTVNLAANYSSEPLFNDVRLNARLDANWRSEQTGLGGVPATFSGIPASQIPAEQEAFRSAMVIDSYWVVNGRLELEGFKLGGADASVALWARNLLDTKAINYAISFTLAHAADYEQARSFGVDLRFEF